MFAFGLQWPTRIGNDVSWVEDRRESATSSMQQRVYGGRPVLNVHQGPIVAHCIHIRLFEASLTCDSRFMMAIRPEVPPEAVHRGAGTSAGP